MSRNQAELIKYEAIRLNILSVCLYPCLSYPTCQSQLFCILLQFDLWLVSLYHIFSTLSHTRHDCRRKRLL